MTTATLRTIGLTDHGDDFGDVGQRFEAGNGELGGTEEERAKRIAGELKPLMDTLRNQCDQLENMVADNFWPLPKYREMLLLS